MQHIATTKMSSKGQVVIPENIRHDLNLEEGTEFVVLGERDTVILKTINKPSLEDLKELLAKAGKQAKKAKLKKNDVTRAILRSRKL